MKRLAEIALQVMLIVALNLYDQKLIARQVDSDHWTATDALGRTLPNVEEAGEKREGKTVAMFYWTWHQGDDDTTYQVRNISEIIRQHPEAMKDYNHTAWGTKRPGFFYWEEPLFGYYKTTDPWVLRKHAELLADAKVDVVFFDCTNGSLTWEDSYEVLLKTWAQAKADGVQVPKIAFMLPFGPMDNSLVSLRQLYRSLYDPGRYEDLWFFWKGKPCIMAYPDNLGNGTEDQAIRNFFTFRPGQPDYVDGPQRNDQWAWLENYPQHGYVRDKNGIYEQVAVGVAQNAGPQTNGHCSAFNLPGTYARNFSQQKGFDPRPDGYLHGWNFQEQWERAFELDPELVFITGWNEFIAGQWLPEHGWTGKPFSFVDQFDWARSRDIEPNKGWGKYGDVYYLQLVDAVRRFKGVSVAERASDLKVIRPGYTEDWEDVRPLYRHYRGNTKARAHRGRYNQYYEDHSGRNDIISAQVARDESMIYFHVETAEKLSSPTDSNWMMLFIDLDRDKSTGWNGYDLIVNRVNPNGNKAFVERNIGGEWAWEELTSSEMSINGQSLDLAIPRKAIGLSEKGINLEFKWSDNLRDLGNVMDFYVSGDHAPGGRFNFVYNTKD